MTGNPSKPDDFSLPPVPLAERILDRLAALFWFLVPLAAAVAGFIFLNRTTGMSLGHWVVALILVYVGYRVSVWLNGAGRLNPKDQ